jgi:hypothetical protein
MIRIFGYFLLILGFLWLLLWCAGSVYPLTRSIGIENFAMYSPKGTYSGTQVQDAIRSVLIEYRSESHGIVIPSILMLVGGIILDLRTRWSSKHKGMPNHSRKRPGDR